MTKKMWNNISICFRGFIGMAATGTSFYVSILPKVEALLRVGSLLVGITVGVLTIRSLLKKKDK